MSAPKTVLFVNPFEFDFTHTWDREAYTFPAGKKMYIQDYLAHHFAKHLVDAKLNRMNLPTDFKCADSTQKNYEYDRETLLKKCIFEGEESLHTSSLKQETDLLNKKPAEAPSIVAAKDLKSEVPFKPFCDSCDSKGVRHKKDCPNNPHRIALEPDAKEQFESLNQ